MHDHWRTGRARFCRSVGSKRCTINCWGDLWFPDGWWQPWQWYAGRVCRTVKDPGQSLCYLLWPFAGLVLGALSSIHCVLVSRLVRKGFACPFVAWGLFQSSVTSWQGLLDFKELINYIWLSNWEFGFAIAVSVESWREMSQFIWVKCCPYWCRCFTSHVNWLTICIYL